jgi:two-component system, LytTR family, response regulator
MEEIKINCLVLDDEQHAVDVLISHIGDTPGLNLVCATTNQQEAMRVMTQEAIDLVFLDVQMPGVTGIEFLNIMRGNYHVIFYSAYSQYAVDGFENDVVDFFLKPVGYARFLKGIQKVRKLVNEAHEMQITENDTPEYIFVKNGVKGKSVKISFSELLYVEAQKNYVLFYQRSGKVITYMSISEAAEKLPAKYFMRVHRSFIVRTDQVTIIEGNTIWLKDCEKSVSIGEHYKQSLLNLLGIT